MLFRSSIKVKKNSGTFVMAEGDLHRFKIDINNICQHRAAGQETTLTGGDPVVKYFFPADAGRISNQAVVTIDNGQGSGGRGIEKGIIIMVKPGGFFGETAKEA